jgi:exopolysaccharide production protein ExoZ
MSVSGLTPALAAGRVFHWHFPGYGLALIIKNIQALRAIAANGVLISHLLIVEQKYSHSGPLLCADARFGAFGVDLFFVTSGLIMATIATDTSWWKFLADRAQRILPPYWFYTTLVLIVSLIAPAIVNSSFAQPPSLWRSYLLIPDTVDPLLAVGWTLIHEMYFYLSFALMIFLIRSCGFTLPFLLLTWMPAVVSLDAVLKINDITDPVAVVVAHPLTLEFAFGAMIGILIQRKIAACAALALMAGIAAFMVIVLWFPGTAAGLIADRSWMRPFLIGAPCALIVYAAVAMEIRGALNAPRWLTVLGDASYSTYLSHVLVLSALGRLFAMAPNHNVYLEAAFVIICVVAANAIGWLSCRLIEHRPGKGRGVAKSSWFPAGA